MTNKQIREEFIEQAGKAMLVQKNQGQAVEKQLDKFKSSLSDLSRINNSNLDELDKLLMEAKLLANDKGIEINNYEKDIEESLQLSKEEKENIKIDSLGTIDIVEDDDDDDDDESWENYFEKLNVYAENNNIDFSKDPYESLLSEWEKGEIARRIKEDYTAKKADCDKYDYLIAAFCGIASGLVDVFFVGAPGESKLGKWSDDKVDGIVESFTKAVWNSDKKNGITKSKVPEGIVSSIGYLEGRFKVNYDARYASDLKLGNEIINMSAKNHHLKSLSHAPDLIGLFFSILDQFTGEGSFISEGKIIRLEPVENKFMLKGGNLIAKIFSGFANWLGHIMSDIAGSSGTRGHNDGRRGAGVGIPFFELFQFCEFGSFDVNGDKKTLAEFSVRIFEEGYDARHGVALAIPVLINEIMIRLLWTIKSRFYHKNSWKDSNPFKNIPELRRMLLVGHGTLCLLDGGGALVKSGGNVVSFALNLNIVAWSKFAMSGLKEMYLIYNRNAINIELLDKDLDKEWKNLYASLL